MIKRIFILAVLLGFAMSIGVQAELSKVAPAKLLKAFTGDEPMPNVPVYPYKPGTITDTEMIGITYYDYQTNGSSGNRVAICEDGSIYVSWMWLPSWPYPPAPRHVYFNWLSPDGEWYSPEEGGPVSVTSGAGYTNLDIIYGNRGAITYHSASGNPPTYVTLSVDVDPPGIGFFDHYNPPDEIFPQPTPNPGRMYWPYIAVDGSDNVHLLMTENTPSAGHFQRMCYTNSTDGGTTWATLQLVDTVMVISGVMDASPVSDKVVMAYSMTQDTSTQVKNDIAYVLSEDGTTWDFRNGIVNVTNFLDDPDSLWAYTDLDVIFDYNDDIHIVWTESWTSSAGGTYFRTRVQHYTDATEEITTALPYFIDSTWYDICGAWNKPYSKMNLGVYEGPPQGLFMTYTKFDTTDISSGGYGNGEIYMTYSEDFGATWQDGINLTETPTPDCFAGDCDSDHWSTLADVVDDELHILFINDKDAGGIVQTEGAATENPVMYMTYPNPLLGVEENHNRPLNFSVAQNYPNPFNAKTTISFELKQSSPVKVEIFDITGAKVTTLADKTMSAGQHNLVWNAEDVASGVYYYRLSSNDQSVTKEAVLLK